MKAILCPPDSSFFLCSDCRKKDGDTQKLSSLAYRRENSPPVESGHAHNEMALVVAKAAFAASSKIIVHLLANRQGVQYNASLLVYHCCQQVQPRIKGFLAAGQVFSSPQSNK